MIKRDGMRAGRIELLMRLTCWRLLIGLGFMSWLIRIVFAFPVFPLKRPSAALFDTVMALAVVATASWLGRQYFRGNGRPRVGEAVLLGLVWLAINLVMDYPMFSY